MESTPAANEFWMSHFQSRLLSTDGVTAFSTKDAAEAALGTIDSEISAMHSMISAAKMRRNAISTVSRLPPEVLSNIFSILTAVDPPTHKRTFVERNFINMRGLGWIRVTQVCRLWRHIALGDARLWTDICAQLSPLWMTEMLERSNQTLFTFSANFNTESEGSDKGKLMAVVEEVLSPRHLARLKGLHFNSWNPRYMRTAIKRLDQAAPLLDSLSIRSGTIYNASTRLVPDDIFASTLPQLRNITFEGWIPASWDVHYLRNLTSLEISRSSDDPVYSMSIAKCFEILENSPQLETLVLKHVVSSTSKEMLPSGHEAVALPCLTKFAIHGSVPGLIALFSGLIIPRTSAVEVGFHTSHARFSELISLLVPFSRGADASASPTRKISIDCMRKGRRSEKHILLGAFDEAGAQRNMKKISIAYDAPDDAWPGVVQQFCAQLDLRGVSRLVLSGSELRRLNKTALQAILRCVPGVARLVLVGQYTADALAVLAKAAPKPRRGRRAASPVRDRPLLLPAMTEVKLVNAFFDVPGYGGRASFGSAVLGMAQAREAFGADVDRLGLKDCVNARKWVDMLAEYVGQVVVEDTPPEADDLDY